MAVVQQFLKEKELEHEDAPKRLTTPSRWLCALLLVGITFLLYVHFALAFGVNVPYWDDWELLDQIRLIYSGQMPWWKLLISKHNEHLIGVAFVLESWQFLLTSFNYKLQLLTGVLIQALTFLLFAAALWRSIPANRRPLWLAVSALIWFSLSQYKNLLWAFQTAWFLVSFFLAIASLCLQRASEMEEREERWGTWFAVAVTAAVLGTFTSSQGTIIWLAGAALLIGSRSFKRKEFLRSRVLRSWLISAALTGSVAAYVWEKMGGGGAEGGGKFTLHIMRYIFVGIHGDFWGNLGVHGLTACGVVMLGFVCFALAKVYVSKERGAYALPVSLIVFGVCFVLLVSEGRAKFGIGPASDSHYTAYSVMTYFAVLSILMRQDDTIPKFYPSRWGLFVYCATILLAASSSYYDALLHGIEWRSQQGTFAAVLLNYRDEPDFVLAQTLFGDPAMVRRNAQFLEINKFGAFGDSNVVPESVRSYTIMPKSMQDMAVRHPQQLAAIRRAWLLYQIAGDLRNAFNPLSDDFAHSFLDWCANASQTSSSHYLSPYLAPFAADYAAIKRTELMSNNSR